MFQKQKKAWHDEVIACMAKNVYLEDMHEDTVEMLQIYQQEIASACCS